MNSNEKAFIEEVGPIAAADMRNSGVPASLTVAQAILESGWGASGLAVRANNLFGIKAGTTWTGRVYSADTKECYDGKAFETVKAMFRAYSGWAESIADHSAVLTAPRYAAVIGAADYKEACRAVQAGGYATDPAYAEKLIRIIEKYGLTVYDGEADLKGEDHIMNEQEKRFREIVVQTAQGFLGCKESDGSHRKIIDIYNADAPIPRNYKMTYRDAWCATFVSVVAIQSGTKGIIPKECSCARMIQLFQNMGRWQESDTYIPKLGDIMFYDWQDGANFKATDNRGAPDHVGIVVSCDGKTIRIIEGNYNDQVKYRNVEVNGRYIRGYGLPDYASLIVGASGSSDTAAADPQGLAVGDVVTFTGATHYASADAASGTPCKPGQVKITMVAEGKKHPFHVQAVSGGGSTAYGWVDAADIQTPLKMRVGASVRYSGPVYKDSAGSGQGSDVKGNFTVTIYKPGAKCGVHIGEIGWVQESACEVTG